MEELRRLRVSGTLSALSRRNAKATAEAASGSGADQARAEWSTRREELVGTMTGMVQVRAWKKQRAAFPRPPPPQPQASMSCPKALTLLVTTTGSDPEA